jgi:thiol-disulfide isomerase/thioredoxin
MRAMVPHPNQRKSSVRHPWSNIQPSLAALVVMLLIACGPPPPTTNPVRTLDVEQFHNLISTREFNGLVVVFASWCPPCREELPDLAELYRKAKPDNAQIIAVSIDKGDVQAVQLMVNRLALPFPIYHVGESVAAKYGIVGVPTLMVVRQGRILEKIPGQQSSRELATKLKTFVSGGS